MKAVVIREHGGPGALSFEDVPDPVAGPGEVVVSVRAVGINHLDLWVRKGVPGHVFPLPMIPGNDVAGVIESVGAGVRNVEPGAEVVVAPGISCGVCAACQEGRDHHCPRYGILGETRDGGYAERIAVPCANVMPKPANLSFEEAASMPLAFLTAWHMLTARAKLRANETVLVQAAGSGVSSAAVQIAKLFHADVIATAGSEEKRKQALALGADHVLDSRNPGLAKEVKALTDGRGADIVFDHVGEATWEASTKSLAWQGRFVTCGATTGALVNLNLSHLFFKSLSILGSTMGSKGELREILAHAERGRLKPVLARALPLGEAREAHRMLEAREVFGKLVLVP
ncbi:MAG: zinc-binding dehydrogenase [Gemmatimonadetes bacterium]|nr:zinc-binding dehydrogenase [Gemmatimonadota bacterium]